MSFGNGYKGSLARKNLADEAKLNGVQSISALTLDTEEKS
jgi:hypothetical protein